MTPGSRPPVPAPGDEKGRAEYEQWLLQHESLLTIQVKYLEAQITKQRKTKKAHNARQRQVKKMGQELPVNESQELEKVSQEQALIQRQLDTSRRKLRQHQMTIQEYRMKQGQLGPMMSAPMGGPSVMMGPGGALNPSMAPTSGTDTIMGGPQMGVGGPGGPRMTGPSMGGPQMPGGPPQMGGPGPRGMMMQMGPGNPMMAQQMGGNQMMGMQMNMPGPNAAGGGPSPINRGGPSPIGGIRGASPVSGQAQNPNLDAQHQQQPSRSPLMSPNNLQGPTLQSTMSPNGKCKFLNFTFGSLKLLFAFE